MSAAALAPALLVAVLAPSLIAASSAARADDAPAAAAKDSLRPEVGKPLQAAQALMKERKFKDALAKIKEAEAVPARTPYENFVIDQMRGSAAANDGDELTAMRSYEAVVNSGRLPAADALRITQAIASTYYSKLKDYPRAEVWAQRYLKEGGTDPTARDLLINSYYLNNEYPQALAELKALLDADEKAGRTTTEQHLLLLLSCYQKLKDAAGSSAALEKLLVSYPKKEYWDQAISHLMHKASFAERLELDLLRLRFALKDFKRDSDYMDMAQLSIEAGFPMEAKRVVDQGFAAGILGKGAEAERHKRLQALADKEVLEDQKLISAGDVDAEKAKTGDGLINAGFNYILNGKIEKGVALLEQGLRKGELRRPDDAKLHVGIAYLAAGDRSKAVQILRTVTGTDGAADIAHLWVVHAASSS